MANLLYVELGHVLLNLQALAGQVCEKVEEKARTTYNEVADELVAEFSNVDSAGELGSHCSASCHSAGHAHLNQCCPGPTTRLAAGCHHLSIAHIAMGLQSGCDRSVFRAICTQGHQLQAIAVMLSHVHCTRPWNRSS